MTAEPNRTEIKLFGGTLAIVSSTTPPSSGILRVRKINSIEDMSTTSSTAGDDAQSTRFTEDRTKQIPGDRIGRRGMNADIDDSTVAATMLPPISTNIGWEKLVPAKETIPGLFEVTLEGETEKICGGSQNSKVESANRVCPERRDNGKCPAELRGDVQRTVRSSKITAPTKMFPNSHTTLANFVIDAVKRTGVPPSTGPREGLAEVVIAETTWTRATANNDVPAIESVRDKLPCGSGG
jgi:hypothetical protein